MSVVVITGSAGLIGSEASEYYLSKGYTVIGIDNNMRKFFLVMKQIHHGTGHI